MNYLKRYVGCLMVVCVVFACNHTNKTTDAENVANKSAANTLVEDFDTFFKKFNSDSVFQRSRVNFPFKVTQVNDDDTKTTRLISAKQWEYINLVSKESPKNIVSKHWISKNKTNVKLQVEDTGIQIDHYFENRNGKWWLVAMTDLSD